MKQICTVYKSIISSFLSLIRRFFKGSNVYTNTIEDTSLYSPSRQIFNSVCKSTLARVGAIGFVFVFLLSFIGSALLPLNDTYLELTHANIRPGINYLSFPKNIQNEPVKKIVSGVSFSAALTESGTIHLWGTEPNKEQKNVSGYIFDIPKEVLESTIVDIASGGNHVVAVDDKGTMYSWGYNGNGQLDIPSLVKNTLKSPQIDILKMEAKSQWTAVLASNGRLYIWGSTQAENTFRIPSSVQGRIVSFSGGDTNIALLLDDGTVSIIGERGSEFALQVPKELTDGSVFITDIVASNKNVLALDNAGILYAWGSTQDSLNTIPQNLTQTKSIYAGYKNFIAVDSLGKVHIWGNNMYSQIEEASNIENISKLYADYYQFYAIDTHNDIHSFGNNGFLFGTDQFGRDVFTRILHGGRISLTVGAIAVVISVSLALLVGLISGYFGGIVDTILMRITDVFSSIPFYPIAITLSYAIGHSMSQTSKLYLIMVILGLLGWMSLARLIRAQLLLEREKDFVLAAKALGLKNSAIMIRHILPNVFNLVIVNITLGYASSLLSEAALSFLGFGVTEPTPSWGNMLTSAQDIAVIEFYWWRWVIPALFVVITALSVNLVGDALREAMDPKTKDTK